MANNNFDPNLPYLGLGYQPQPSEDSIKRMVMLSKIMAIGEGLKVFADAIGAGTGAPVERRNPMEKTFQTLQMIEAMKDEDRKRLDAWRMQNIQWLRDRAYNQEQWEREKRFRVGERVAEQKYRTGERESEQLWRTREEEKQRKFQSSEATQERISREKIYGVRGENKPIYIPAPGGKTIERTRAQAEMELERALYGINPMLLAGEAFNNADKANIMNYLNRVARGLQPDETMLIRAYQSAMALGLMSQAQNAGTQVGPRGSAGVHADVLTPEQQRLQDYLNQELKPYIIAKHAPGQIDSAISDIIKYTKVDKETARRILEAWGYK